MEQTSFITSKCETKSGETKFLLRESVEYIMYCINYAKRKQEKPLLFKLALRPGFTLSSLRIADAFPVVASRRERSDDRKCVCCSQANTIKSSISLVTSH